MWFRAKLDGPGATAQMAHAPGLVIDGAIVAAMVTRDVSAADPAAPARRSSRGGFERR